MKLKIEQTDKNMETEVIIRCGPVIDKNLQTLIDRIRLQTFSITARKQGIVYPVMPEDIYYFESVDEKTFLYTERDVLECGSKLYELEQRFSDTSFVRINKSVIMNTEKLKSVRPLLNGRFEVSMDNGEKLLVSRHYVPAFRDKFEI